MPERAREGLGVGTEAGRGAGADFDPAGVFGVLAMAPIWPGKRVRSNPVGAVAMQLFDHRMLYAWL